MSSKSAFIRTFFVLIVIFGLIYGAYRYVAGMLSQDTDSQTSIGETETPTLAHPSLTEADIRNIAIFGIDSETGDKGRSDATMILSLDNEHHKLKICSIARDTLVYIPEKNVYEKFTHAYAYGGAALAVETLNLNFNMNISDYISVNFSEMADIIDLFGGVAVDLSEEERNLLPDADSLSVGSVKLNGEQAVAYSRIRYIDNDNMRRNRQREILTNMFQRSHSLSSSQYPSFIMNCMSTCTTSLKYRDLISFSQQLINNDLTLEQMSLPDDADTLDAWGGIMPSSGAWCFVYDLHDASDLLYTFIYEELYTESDIELPEAMVDKSFIH